MNHVFISHIEEDNSLADEIARCLEDAGYITWYYERDSVPGLSYLAQVGEAIEQAEVIVTIISPDALNSHQMNNEIIRSYECKKPFIPILHNITYVEFQQHQPVWRQAMVGSTSISIPQGGIPAILPRVIAGLKALSLQPTYKSSSQQAAATTPTSESTEVHKDKEDVVGSAESKLESLQWHSRGARPKPISKPKPITKPKAISKPKTKMPPRWALLSLGIILLLIAGVSGVYFTSGHLFTPSATSPPDTTTLPPETTTPPPDTTAPVISKVTVAGYTGETATITWETDEDAIGQVEYGTTEVYGKLAATDGEFTANHSVELTGLQPKTNYHFQVRSTDKSGNEIVSGDNTFNSGVSQKDWKEYVNEEYGFSIQYPADWVERPELVTVKDIHLAAFGIEAFVPGVVCYAYDADAPETKEWIVKSFKATGNQVPKVTSVRREQSLPVYGKICFCDRV
jgi:hypothetical protein